MCGILQLETLAMKHVSGTIKHRLCEVYKYWCSCCDGLREKSRCAPEQKDQSDHNLLAVHNALKNATEHSYSHICINFQATELLIALLQIGVKER